ncbi:MAG: sterol desaturase family protein [Flavobacteriales bacterium]|nr:sterol desaturase family protein [Flavobacteriales bacterium]
MYPEIIRDAYSGYWNYLREEILNPGWHNYFYWLIAISLVFWMLEIIIPWRKEQGIIRKDFWLDAFYMFFNFFLFSLIIYNALSDVFVEFFTGLLNSVGINNLVAVEVDSWPAWLQLITLFIVRDFIQFNVHRLLHRVPVLWQFHKVHHSVLEMGFAAHLRYHWMENIVYRSIEYIPLAMIGFGIDDFFIVHILALAIGHFNHSNLNIPLGPLKYLLNNPQMHIWHHVHTDKWPEESKHGINYGISLSIWDYIFKTAHIPNDGKDENLGFEEVEKYPTGFSGQMLIGFKRPKAK